MAKDLNVTIDKKNYTSENPPLVHTIHPVVVALLENGFTVETFYRDGRIQHRISGFYKSGHITLSQDQHYQMHSRGSKISFDCKEPLVAECRYGVKTEVSEFDDLVRLNYDHWVKSKHLGFTEPDHSWVPYMLKMGIITKKLVTVYE